MGKVFVPITIECTSIKKSKSFKSGEFVFEATFASTDENDREKSGRAGLALTLGITCEFEVGKVYTLTISEKEA